MIRQLITGLTGLVVAIAPLSAKAVPGHYLFVFSGDQAGGAKDFLAVLDADPGSPSYGKVVTSVATDQVSVRPHHTEYQMPASGMLFANDHNANRSFIFDLRNPVHPKVAATFGDMGGFAMPHSFLRLPNGHVLVSFQQRRNGSGMPGMGDMAGMDGKEMSGGIVEIDDAGKEVRAVSNADPAHPDWPLLPYSLVPLPGIDRVLVTNSPMQDEYLLQSITYQIFRLSDLKLLGTYQLDPGPSLIGHLDPEEPRIGPDGSVYIQTLSCGCSESPASPGPIPQPSSFTSSPARAAESRP